MTPGTLSFDWSLFRRWSRGQRLDADSLSICDIAHVRATGNTSPVRDVVCRGQRRRGYPGYVVEPDGYRQPSHSHLHQHQHHPALLLATSKVLRSQRKKTASNIHLTLSVAHFTTRLSSHVGTTCPSFPRRIIRNSNLVFAPRSYYPTTPCLVPHILSSSNGRQAVGDGAFTSDNTPSVLAVCHIQGTDDMYYYSTTFSGGPGVRPIVLVTDRAS